ncbi:RNA polymerase sigma factor [Mucilaginibacter sp.]|uniref:RNA polymerase sigma factor n=1 Tax=Mucilaginibacter sp. TaxID=1882438 RepID=UPI003AFFF6C7
MGDKFITSNYVLRLMAGEEAAFASFYEFYAEKVYRLAFKFLKDHSQSEEIVQETFIKLWLNRSQLNPQSNIWLYLFVIAKRLSLNALRQQGQSTFAFEQFTNHHTEIYNITEEQVIAHDLEQFTERILQKLPKQQQQVYNLSRKEGLSHKEIAQKLKISTNTVKNHMVAALKFLKTYLKYADFIGLIFLFLQNKK